MKPCSTPYFPDYEPLSSLDRLDLLSQAELRQRARWLRGVSSMRLIRAAVLAELNSRFVRFNKQSVALRDGNAIDT